MLWWTHSRHLKIDPTQFRSWNQPQNQIRGVGELHTSAWSWSKTLAARWWYVRSASTWSMHYCQNLPFDRHLLTINNTKSLVLESQNCVEDILHHFEVHSSLCLSKCSTTGIWQRIRCFPTMFHALNTIMCSCSFLGGKIHKTDHGYKSLQREALLLDFHWCHCRSSLRSKSRHSWDKLPHLLFSHGKLLVLLCVPFLAPHLLPSNIQSLLKRMNCHLKFPFGFQQANLQ